MTTTANSSTHRAFQYVKAASDCDSSVSHFPETSLSSIARMNCSPDGRKHQVSKIDKDISFVLKKCIKQTSDGGNCKQQMKINNEGNGKSKKKIRDLLKTAIEAILDDTALDFVQDEVAPVGKYIHKENIQILQQPSDINKSLDNDRTNTDTAPKRPQRCRSHDKLKRNKNNLECNIEGSSRNFTFDCTTSSVYRNQRFSAPKTQECSQIPRRSISPAPRKPPSRRNVSFGEVQCRAYEQIILCNNPTQDITSGPKLGIGWRFQQVQAISIDEYERARAGYRRQSSRLLLSKKSRENIARTL